MFKLRASVTDSGPELNQHWVFDMNSRNILNDRFNCYFNSCNYRGEWNNAVLDHLCAYIGLTGPGEPLEDGEMNDMTVEEREAKERKSSRKYKVVNGRKCRKRSQAVANDRNRTQTVANGRNRSQTVANGLNQSQAITKGRKWSQTVGNSRKRSQMIANCRKRSQTVANGSKRSQTGKRSHAVSNGCKRSQTVANGRKRSQIVASGRTHSKRSQIIANGRKWS